MNANHDWELEVIACYYDKHGNPNEDDITDKVRELCDEIATLESMDDPLLATHLESLMNKYRALPAALREKP
jgi:hypothetical protein